MPPTPPGPCRTCADPLARCWVCGKVDRCSRCQQCARCEGLTEHAAGPAVAMSLSAMPMPSVRRKSKAPPPPPARPKPEPAAPEPKPKRPKSRPAAEPRRLVARRVRPPAEPDTTAADVVWYLRAAVTPALMILAAYLAYTQFRSWTGLALVVMCILGFYLPYVILTPERRRGQFFPLGDEGAGLPVVMVIGGLLVGGICGIALGVVGGERVGMWGGGGVALIAFHLIYYSTLNEQAAQRNRR